MEINKKTYEEFFLLYVDGELDTEQRLEVEDFVRRHPELQEEFELMQHSVLVPEEDIEFANKEVLYKEERKRMVVPFPWRRMAAAAVLLFAVGSLGWLYLRERPVQNTGVTVADKNTELPPAKSPEKSAGKPAGNAKAEKPAMQPVTVPDEQPVSNKPSADMAKLTVNKTTQEKKARVIAITPRDERFETMPTKAVVENNPGTDIAVEVKGRKLDEEINETPLEMMAVNAVQQQPVEMMDDDSGDDMIYFANTSVSKRNKLRGVFRKATRILDKVTSSQ